MRNSINKNAGTAIGTIASPGIGTVIGYGMDQGRQAKRQAQEQADNQESRIAAAQAQRDANITKLKELFGIGSTTEATTNARTLNDAINKYYKLQSTQNLRQADTGFESASRIGRQNLARVGQLGGGLEAGAKAATLSDYLRTRQKAIASAAGQRDALRNRLTSQRLGLEQQISTGQTANPDFQNVIANRDAELSSAQSNVVPAAIGNAFTTAGSTYFQGRQQEAMGNQGMQAFGLGSSSNRGSIT